MQDAVITISYLCILMAICAQFLNGSAYTNALRFALGLEIMHVMIKAAKQAVNLLR